MLTDRIERELRNRWTRRSYLEGAGAVIGVWMIPGVTADRATADDGDDLNLREEPFAHVLSPSTLNQFGRQGGPMVELPEEMTAQYADLEQMREYEPGWQGSDNLRENYPQAMYDIKVGGAGDPEATKDVRDHVIGKCGDGLIRTTYDYDALNGMLQEQGFRKEDKEGDWTFFDGTGGNGLPDRDMKVAVNGGNMAYITGDTGENTASIDDLGVGISMMIDMLTGEEWLSLQSNSGYARYAEYLLHNEGDGEWDRVHLQTESVEARMADDRDPSEPVSVVTLTEYGADVDEIRIKKLKTLYD